MKLTDEMRAAIEGALDELYRGRPVGTIMITDGDAATFFAGYRMGQQAMRERAAKACEPEDGIPTMDDAEFCARLIRRLPIEE